MSSLDNFSQLTTLRLGGKFRDFIQVEDPLLFREFLWDNLILREEFFLIGAGSNLVVSDAPNNDRVVRLVAESDSADIIVNSEEPESKYIRVNAGCLMDEVIALTIAQGCGGLELLSGIPGTVGGGVVQNIGAYGIEIAQLVHSVYLYDRVTDQNAWVTGRQLAFSYRNSLLKYTNRYVVLQVKLLLTQDSLSRELSYPDILRRAQIPNGTRLNAGAVRELILRLRAEKAMLLQPDDYDTWSVGSFFTNPIITRNTLEFLRANTHHAAAEMTDMPVYQQLDGSIKLSAAWLIEQAGFYKGYPGEESPVRVSTKHTLALTNRGSGSTEQLLHLASMIRHGVHQKYGIWLEPEPIFRHCSLSAAS